MGAAADEQVPPQAVRSVGKRAVVPRGFDASQGLVGAVRELPLVCCKTLGSSGGSSAQADLGNYQGRPLEGRIAVRWPTLRAAWERTCQLRPAAEGRRRPAEAGGVEGREIDGSRWPRLRAAWEIPNVTRPTLHAARATGCGAARGGVPPNRPISRILSWAVIYLGPALPPASCGLPGTWRAACGRPCLALLPAEVSRFTPGAYSCLFPGGCHKRRASSLCPYSCPSSGEPNVGRRVLPAAVLGGVRTFLPDAKVGATVWPARRLPPPVRNAP